MINPDILIERSKLKHQVSSWRALSFLIIIIMLLILFGDKGFSDLKGIATPYIARIDINNVIYDDNERDEIIEEIAKDDNIKAVIMHVNSPGGTAVGGESLYRSLKKLRETKPVVTVMGSMATSAAYLIALASDRIYAYNGTITGSIGVIMQVPNFKEAGDKLGIKLDYVKTSSLKGSPSPFEQKNEKAFEIIGIMIQDFYKYFVNLVSIERKITYDKALELADGRIFSGKAALDSKLVDEIGDEKDAIKWLEENKKIDKDLKVKDVKLYKPEAPLGQFFDSISEKLGFKSFFDSMSFQGLIL